MIGSAVQPLGLDHRISLQKLEVFCLVTELGSVTRAAEQLIVAQPVVTAHIRSRGVRVGTPLLYRDGRRMRLTDAGEAVHAWAAETLARTRAMTRELTGLADGQRGTAVLAASMSLGSYVLPPLLIAFRRERAQAEITLHVSDPEGAIAAAEHGDADVAVVVAQGPGGAADQLEWEHLGATAVVLVAAPGSPPGGDRVTPADLADLPMIASPRGHVRRTLVDRQLAKAGAEPRNLVIELGHPEAMKRAARAGLGAALLFRDSVTEELARGELREIAIEGVTLSIPVFAVHRRGKRFTALQLDLLATLRGALAGH
jgi:LysR family transcriptional regulator, low CO2-responsive transcriptional regulator